MEAPRSFVRVPHFQNPLECFLSDKVQVSCPRAEGWFAVLTSDLRKEIWAHIADDATFANSSRVNRLWHKELEQAWFQFCLQRGYFDDSFKHFEKSGKKDWKWMLKCIHLR
jgi:hypothetical protein